MIEIFLMQKQLEELELKKIDSFSEIVHFLNWYNKYYFLLLPP